jgi:hypothetical protein
MMTRRTFFATLAGLAVARTVPVAPAASSRQPLADIDASIQRMLARNDDEMLALLDRSRARAREIADLSSYLNEIAAQHQANLNAAPQLFRPTSH